jgi:ATP-binding cassette, subfamily B, multidrug efflux pump
MVWTFVSIVAVAVIEIGLIWYAGRLVDVLADAEQGQVWTTHGLELMLVARSSCSCGRRSRR